MNSDELVMVVGCVSLLASCFVSVADLLVTIIDLGLRRFYPEIASGLLWWEAQDAYSSLREFVDRFSIYSCPQNRRPFEDSQP